jgi:hypothetical protein
VGRGFLLPVLLSGAVSGVLLRQLENGHHLWQPQQRWLVLASRPQRQAVAREMERGGCAVPAAIEWRDPLGTAPLPPMLAELLGLQGVALGVGDAVRGMAAARGVPLRTGSPEDRDGGSGYRPRRCRWEIASGASSESSSASSSNG